MHKVQRFISCVLVCLLIFSTTAVAFAAEEQSGNTTLITSVPARITFEANGGRGTMEAVSVDVGTEYTLPGCGFTAPRGKVFRCWSIGTRRYEPGDTITVNSHVTVTALWKLQIRFCNRDLQQRLCSCPESCRIKKDTTICRV